MGIRSRRDWRFDAPLTEVWNALAAVDAYPSWWPWLRRFDATSLTEGQVWRCTVKPPLPYSLTFDLTLDSVVDQHSIKATLSGDLCGTARIDLEPADEATRLQLTSSIEARRRPVAMLERLAGPIARWGHDWVLDTGARQFAAALSRPTMR